MGLHNSPSPVVAVVSTTGEHLPRRLTEGAVHEMLWPYFFQQPLHLRKGGDYTQSDTRDPQECCVGPIGPDLCKAGALRRYRPAMLGRAQISISGFAGGAQKHGLELRWRCGVSGGRDGWQLRRLARRAAAWARPHIPRSTGGELPRWVYVSTVYFVTQAVAEQQGGRRAASKPYLCPPRHVELVGQKMVEGDCRAQAGAGGKGRFSNDGECRLAGGMEGKIFFRRPLRSCEFVARQEAMKSGEELCCQVVWGEFIPVSHPAHLCFPCCRNYLVQVCGFNWFQQNQYFKYCGSTFGLIFRERARGSPSSEGFLGKGCSLLSACRSASAWCSDPCAAAWAGGWDPDPQHGGIQMCLSRWHPNKQASSRILLQLLPSQVSIQRWRDRYFTKGKMEMGLLHPLLLT